MFGMGFGEILLVVILAIIFLGPEKLPGTLIQIAKFFRTVKKNLTEAKDTIDRELDIAQMKQEALSLKQSVTKITDDTKEEITAPSREVKDLFADINKPLDEEEKAKTKDHEKKL